jgi:hypothetical protein
VLKITRFTIESHGFEPAWPPGNYAIQVGTYARGGDRWNNGGKIAAAEQIFGGRVRQYKEVQLTMFN